MHCYQGENLQEKTILLKGGLWRRDQIGYCLDKIGTSSDVKVDITVVQPSDSINICPYWTDIDTVQ